MTGDPSALHKMAQLHPGRAGERPIMPEQALSPAMTLLRTWQMERLQRTHADLLLSERYGPASRFFLSDIYAPRDFSQRDRDVEHIYAVMSRYLPLKMLDTLRLVIVLNDLTNALDNRLVEVLTTQLGMTTHLTAEMYAEGYRRCDNYAERRQQITLLTTVGEGVNKLVHRPFVSALLRLAHGPAHRHGWGDLQGFLERGFSAFQAMQDATPFLAIIERREWLILDRIFASHPTPFEDVG